MLSSVLKTEQGQSVGPMTFFCLVPFFDLSTHWTSLKTLEGELGKPESKTTTFYLFFFFCKMDQISPMAQYSMSTPILVKWAIISYTEPRGPTTIWFVLMDRGL